MMLAKALASASASAAKIYVEDVFSTRLYTGNSSTQTISGLGFSPDFVWLKQRTNTENHGLFDTVRGAQKSLCSNNINAENATDTSSLTAFTSDGFSLGNTSRFNDNTYAHVAWTFRKAPGFFDVVTYTGDGVAGRTVAHNLGSVPGCIIVKSTSTNLDWQVYHRSTGATQNLVLNSTAVPSTSTIRWNDTEPTASVFTLGSGSQTNGNGVTYVAYLFAHDEQIFGEGGDQSVIKCGVFTGTSNINLGWEPQWLLVKRTDTTSQWNLMDTMRGFGVTGDNRVLSPNLSSFEDGSVNGFRITSTGFEYTFVPGTYIYIAIRRGPMKTPTDATTVFYADKYAEVSNPPGIGPRVFGFAPDLLFHTRLSGGYSYYITDKLRGADKQLQSSSTSAEFSAATYTFNNNGATPGFYFNNSPGDSASFLGFRRAPGFFDVMAYTGNGSNRTIAHNLGSVPECMIIKRRDTTGNWIVYHQNIGPSPAASYYLWMQTADGRGSSGNYFNDTTPTSSVFTVGVSNDVNASGGTYIAYLFATCPGVSKVGSYTGTGTTKQIDCGFTSGARFVLIKRTDSTGDWYVWDTARGIVSGNDPYLLLNSTAAEVTNTDYIDPLNSGFEISSTAPAAINANGGSFIFLAIA